MAAVTAPAGSIVQVASGRTTGSTTLAVHSLHCPSEQMLFTSLPQGVP
jgi:hypothetical protein